MHIEALSNGLGSQSMAELVLRSQRKIKGEISLTADTGSERDCLWSTGRRTDAQTYYREIVVPICKEIGIESAFIRSVDKHKHPLPPLHVAMIRGDTPNFTPLFGSRKGRLAQTCTDKWKVRAMRQEARRRGATTLRNAIGLHVDEVRRVKGLYVGKEDGFSIFQDTTVRKGKETPVKWVTHYYPLVDLKITRAGCRKMLTDLGIPFLMSTECDMCPHKDGPRWARTSPETIEWAAELESRYEGNFFLTDQRIPLKMAIPNMKMPAEDEVDFGCSNDMCGI